MRIAAWLIVAAGGLVLAIGGIVYVARMRAPVAPDAYHAFSQAEFITIILTAVTVVLTALAIVLALAGAVGYVAIRDASVLAANMKAEEVARQRAEEVAARIAEELVSRELGRRLDAGDDIARVAGDEDVDHGS